MALNIYRFYYRNFAIQLFILFENSLFSPIDRFSEIWNLVVVNNASELSNSDVMLNFCLFVSFFVSLAVIRNTGQCLKTLPPSALQTERVKEFWSSCIKQSRCKGPSVSLLDLAWVKMLVIVPLPFSFHSANYGKILEWMDMMRAKRLRLN